MGYYARKYGRKKLVTNGRKCVYASVSDLVRVLGFSDSTASRVVSGRRCLTPSEERLLCYELLGSLPGMPDGWSATGGEVISPSGFRLNDSQLVQYSFFMQIMRDMERDISRLTNENRLLSWQLKGIVSAKDNSSTGGHLRLVK